MNGNMSYSGIILWFALLLLLARPLWHRWCLSRAKHPSLRGHARLSRILAGCLPYYHYDDEVAYACDAAPPEVVAKRRAAFLGLARRLNEKQVKTSNTFKVLQPLVSDMQFTDAYRVPFQFRDLVSKQFQTGGFADQVEGVRIRDLDGNWSYDLGGSYGVNLLGYDFYKRCIEKGSQAVQQLGPVLGPYHPVVAENTQWLKQISRLDEVSFHMSGTEAVMQAVRLARYHTRRSKLVIFCGAYHGWWDGVQPGVGNPGKSADVFMLRDVHDNSLRVLRQRKDIACVLINPLQAMHPNSGANSDGMLINSERSARFDRFAYTKWLRELRAVCTERNIALIFDEVFLGFRLAAGGAQEYFGVRADLVTYGKTVGGGLPVGVLCGKTGLMKRYREDRPLDVCFARGTFNSHPYVMGSMNEFLRYAVSLEFRQLVAGSEAIWDARATQLNRSLAERELPLRVSNAGTVWTMTYPQPGRFNWLLQFYLRAEGLSLSWVGTGRLIFSLNYTDKDFAAVAQAILHAAEAMRADGWWWHSPALTNQSIKRTVLREILMRRFKS
jgi:glutamate-1-semialdehyde 2,1-aminomutase